MEGLEKQLLNPVQCLELSSAALEDFQTKLIAIRGSHIFNATPHLSLRRLLQKPECHNSRKTTGATAFFFSENEHVPTRRDIMLLESGALGAS